MRLRRTVFSGVLIIWLNIGMFLLMRLEGIGFDSDEGEGYFFFFSHSKLTH